MDSNPTMGGAPMLVEGPTRPCEHRKVSRWYDVDRMRYYTRCSGCQKVDYVDAHEFVFNLGKEGRDIRYEYQDSTSWVDVSKPKVEEPLGMYLDPDHEPFPAKRARPLVGKLKRRKP